MPEDVKEATKDKDGAKYYKGIVNGREHRLVITPLTKREYDEMVREGSHMGVQPQFDKS